MSKTFNILFRNSFSNTLYLVVNIFIAFFLTPFLIISLGDSDYGIWVLIGSISGSFGLLEFGISASIVRYFSKFYTGGDFKSIDTILSTCFFLFLLISILVIFISFAAGLLLPKVIKIPADKESVAFIVLMLSGATLSVFLISRVFTGVLQALMRYDITGGLAVVVNLFRVFLIVVFIKSGYGLISLALIGLLASLLEVFLVAIYAYKNYPELSLRWRFFEKEKIGMILNYSLYNFIIKIGDLLRFTIDSIVIGSLIAVSAITPYAIAQRLISMFMKFIIQVFSIATPLYSSYEAEDDSASIQKLLLKSTFYSALVSFFILMMFIIYGNVFIILWVGTQYAEQAYIVLIIVAFAVVLDLSQNPSMSVAFGMEKHKVLAFITVGEGILNLVLSIILAKKMGLIGVALGTAIPMVIAKGVLQPIYICKVVNISCLKYIKSSFVIPLMAVSIFGLIHLTLRGYLVFIDNFYYFSMATIFSTFLFLFIVLLLLTKEERTFWKNKFLFLKRRFVT